MCWPIIINLFYVMAGLTINKGTLNERDAQPMVVISGIP